jgi:hypothetical protein
MHGPPEVEDIWSRGEDRIVVWVQVFATVEDAAAAFARYSQPMEPCNDWTYT